MATQALVPISQAQPPVQHYSLGEIERMATTFAKSQMFGLRDPAGAFVLMMLADASGMHPVSAFLDYDLIKNKPVKKSEAMMRDFLKAGGKVEYSRLDDECVEATFFPPGGGKPATINWTLARAAKAGLGNKDNWQAYPRQMLRSRVIGEGVKTVWPAATGGLPIPEEIELGHDDEGPSPPKAKRAGDLPAPEPEEEKRDESRVKAETWLMAYESDLYQAKTPHALEDVQKKAAKALTKLGKEHPDLLQKADTLVANAKADLARGREETEASAREKGFGEEDTQSITDYLHGDKGEGPSVQDRMAEVARQATGDNDSHPMTLARAKGIIDQAELITDVRNRLEELQDQLDGADNRAALIDYANERIGRM